MVTPVMMLREVPIVHRKHRSNFKAVYQKVEADFMAEEVGNHILPLGLNKVKLTKLDFELKLKLEKLQRKQKRHENVRLIPADYPLRLI